MRTKFFISFLVTSLIIWSLGVPFVDLLTLKSAQAATFAIANLSSLGQTLKQSSSATGVLKITFGTAEDSQTLTSVRLKLAGTGVTFTNGTSTASDLLNLSTSALSGIAVYKENGTSASGYDANDTIVALGSIPTYTSTGSTATTTLTLGAGNTLADGDIYYIVLKSATSTVANGNTFKVAITDKGDGTDIVTSGTDPTVSATTWTNLIIMDTVGPYIEQVSFIDPTTIEVRFNESLNSTTAQTAGNYTLSTAAVGDVQTITSATLLSDNKTVRVVAAGANISAGGSDNITVNGSVTDAAGNVNQSIGAMPIMAENNPILISEIQIAGASSASSSCDEFIELYNNSGSAINLQTLGLKLHFRNATGTDSNIPLTFASTTIPARGFYLIAAELFFDGTGATTTASSSVDAFYQATSTEQLESNGGVYISTSATAGVGVIDKVGWGSQTVGGYEGMAYSSNPQPSQGLERKAYPGSTAASMYTGVDVTNCNSYDSGNNSYDFVLQTAARPQNSGDIHETQSLADSTAPMIWHMPIYKTAASTTLGVIAGMMDNNAQIANSNTFLYYCVATSTCTQRAQYTQINGTLVTSNHFKFNIPSGDLSASADVKYYLAVTDGTATTTMPSATTTPYLVDVSASAGTNSLSGLVKDISSNPINGALVFIKGTGFNTLTDSGGNFSLSSVFDMTPELQVVKDGYMMADYLTSTLNSNNTTIANIVITLSQGMGGQGGDMEKPRVIQTMPGDLMMGAPRNIAMAGATPASGETPIVIVFSEGMDSATVIDANAGDASSNIYLTSDGTTKFAGAVRYNSNANTAYYYSATQLSAGMMYSLVMTGSIRDSAGNSLSGANPSGGHIISFTTASDFSGMTQGQYGQSGMYMPPFVQGSSPAPGAVNIPVNTNIVVNFSDPISPSTVNNTYIKFYSVSSPKTASESESQITAVSIVLDTTQTSKLVTIDPSVNLSTSATYRVKVLGGVASTNGITLGPPQSPTQVMYSSDFQTAASSAGDSAPPTVAGTYPSNGDINIPVSLSVVEIGFSEAMSPSTINSSTITLKAGSTAINGTVSFDPLSNSSKFSPTVALNPGYTYTLTVLSGSSGAKDLVGNALTNDYTMSFTTTNTADTIAPAVTFVNCSDYMCAVTFSESMKASNLGASDYANSVLNYNNYQIKKGATGTTDWAGITAENLATAQITYDGPTQTATIKGLTLTIGNDFRILPANGSNGVYNAGGLKDLSGNAIGNTAFVGPVQDGMQTGQMMGPGSGGMMGPTGTGMDMGMMGMKPTGVFPMNMMAGQKSIYHITLPLTSAINEGGTIVLTFPAGFDLSLAKKDANSPMNSDINGYASGTIGFATTAETSGGANNDGVQVDTLARTVTVQVGNYASASDFLEFDVADIKNSSVPKDFGTSGYTVDIKTKNAAGKLLQTFTPMAFFIKEGGSLTISGRILSAAPQNDGLNGVTIMLGSPMTGPMSTTTATGAADGGLTGEFKFSSLASGQYMLFTDPTVDIDGNFATENDQYYGQMKPEPIWLTANSTKNFTLTGATSSGIALTVQIGGIFTNNSVDIFAGNPSNFVVKTVTLNGTLTAGVGAGSQTLRLPAVGTYQVGLGPAMPKGPMSGPPAMPDWMPPAPVQVQLVNTAPTWTETSGTANDGKVVFSITTASKQIVGTVKDASNVAIANAEVFAYQPMAMGGSGSYAKTNNSGSFTLKVGANGNYNVGAFLPGVPDTREKTATVYDQSSQTGGDVDGNTTADVIVDGKLITGTNTLTLTLSKPDYTISGKVTDGTSAIPSAPVWAYNSSGGHSDAMTDSSGNYILYVSNGNWTVQSFAPGYGDLPSQSVAVASASVSNINFQPDTSKTYYNITGTITIGGSAVANIPVWGDQYLINGNPSGKGNHTNTNSSGQFTLKVEQGYYRVAAWHPDYGEIVPTVTDQVSGSSANVDASTGNVSNISFTIQSTSLKSLDFIWTGGNANLTADIDIRNFTTDQGKHKYESSLATGTKMTVPSGTYEVHVYVPGFGNFDYAAVDLSSDATTTIDLTSTSIYTVSGWVKNDANTDISDAWVWFGNRTTGFHRGAMTNSNGDYSLQLKAGTYEVGVDRPGYTSPVIASVTISANTVYKFSATSTVANNLISNSLTISGTVYASDGTTPVVGAWVWADKVTGSGDFTFTGGWSGTETDANGTYSLSVSNGWWLVRARAKGYRETKYTAGGSAVALQVAGSALTAKNITLSADSTYTYVAPRSQSITPTSGGTFEDATVGVKMVIPPNAFGSGSNAGQVVAEETTSVPRTSSKNALAGKGKTITATDNSGQAITNLDDSIEVQLNYSDSDIPTGYTEGQLTMSYWDSTTNQWIEVAAIQDTTNNTFVGTINHLTVLAPTLPSDASSPSTPGTSTATAGSGSVSLSWAASTDDIAVAGYEVYRSTTVDGSFTNISGNSTAGGGFNAALLVTSTSYTDSTVSNGTTYYYKVAAYDGSGNYSVAGPASNSARPSASGGSSTGGGSILTIPEVAAPKTTEPVTTPVATPAPAIASPISAFAQKIVEIVADATVVVKSNIETLLAKVGLTRDVKQEQTVAKNYITSLVKGVTGLTSGQKNALTNFVAYGTPTTLRLGAGERAGVISCFRDALGKMPTTQTDWEDVIKIGNGRWPKQTNAIKEKAVETYFKKIYLRNPDRKNPHDDAAVVIMTYGLKPVSRNLNNEKAAIKTFKSIYKSLPSSNMDWKIVRAVAESGAKR